MSLVRKAFHQLQSFLLWMDPHLGWHLLLLLPVDCSSQQQQLQLGGGGGGEDSQGLVGISQNDRSIPIRDGSTGHHSLIICHPFTINLFELRLGCTQASL